MLLTLVKCKHEVSLTLTHYTTVGDKQERLFIGDKRQVTIGNINKLCYKISSCHCSMTLPSGPRSSSRSSWSPTSWDSLARPSAVGSSIQPGSSRAVSVKSLASKKLLLAQVAALDLNWEGCKQARPLLDPASLQLGNPALIAATTMARQGAAGMMGTTLSTELRSDWAWLNTAGWLSFCWLLKHGRANGNSTLSHFSESLQPKLCAGNGIQCWPWLKFRINERRSHFN